MAQSSGFVVLMRGLCSRLCLCSLLALGGAGPLWAAPPEPPAQPIKDPHYGDALFLFYQERHFSALTTLMASQHFERVPRHADEAELLRGGLLLSYGLHRQAGDIFTRLADSTASPSVQNRAWYQLAQVRYQRGWLADAEQALAKISAPLVGDLESERQLLQAQLLMARNDFAGAATVLEAVVESAPKPLSPASNAFSNLWEMAGMRGPKSTLSPQSPTTVYARYNLGVALIKAGNLQEGLTLLDTLGRAPAATEELRSLRDKTNLALGFAELQSEHFEAARNVLERVRLNAAQSNKALLGLGWASAGLNSHATALVPWSELLRRDARDPAVLEAHLAVPYALAELGAPSQALHRYEQAVALFDQQRALLDDSIHAIRSGPVLARWLELSPPSELGSAAPLVAFSETLPHAAQLSPVWAQHEFQAGWQSLRDLHFLGEHLQHWQANLGTFSDMLVQRRQAYEQRLPQVLAQLGATGQGALQQRSQALLTEAAAAADQPDSAAFANASQTQWLQRARSALNNPALDEAPLARERLRRASGALTWQLAQQHPARSRQITQLTQSLEGQLQQAQQRQAALTQAQRDEPARFAAFEVRIQTLSARLQALMPQVATLRQAQEASVQNLMVAALEQQKERLHAYASQAQLAMAQLLDRASTARKPQGSGDAKAQ
jgi:hypothetical protein